MDNLFAAIFLFHLLSTLFSAVAVGTHRKNDSLPNLAWDASYQRGEYRWATSIHQGRTYVYTEYGDNKMAGVVPPKVSCKNEKENRKFQFEQRPAKEKQRHEEKIEKLIKNIPKDIKFYWNNIESAVLLKIGSTTASTAENLLKDLPGVSYRILSNVPEGQQVDDDDYFYTHKIPQLVFKKDFLAGARIT
ncbi:hypothetical protein CYMTET_18409 [Cymbomonas tetramitiformis]|uniref:Uncharacterized protein n=1 Tax=Cymbomonas tetramitiformis TaxID=36881 RepID=A0AAE0G8A3_9CHLO|nr:hypothetical protein CYMTET_18409 [Cymbomonas tetramitiformis]